MGFPTSPFSKAAVTNGQTSDPTDVNDVYTELTNLTDGLINGGAPIHTSNTVVNNLNVGGASTFAGTVNITGNSTVFAVSLRGQLIPTGGSSGVINLNGTNLYGSTASPSPFIRYDSTATAWQVADGNNTKLLITDAGTVSASLQPRCSVSHSAVTALSSNSTGRLSFDTEVFDVGGMHSTASNPSRVTVPVGSSGLYHCVGHLFFATLSTTVNVFLLKNSSRKIETQCVNGAIGGQSFQVIGYLACDAGDVLELEYFSGLSTASLGAASFPNRFMVTKVW